MSWSLVQKVKLRVSISDAAWDSGSMQEVTTALSADLSFGCMGQEVGGSSPASCTVRLAGPAIPWVNPALGRQYLTVEASADDGASWLTRFAGLTDVVEGEYFPQQATIQASGYSSLAAKRLGTTRSFIGQGNDGPITRALLQAVGILDYAIEGSAYQMYEQHALLLRADSTAIGVIDEFCRVTHRPLYDAPSGQVRMDRSLTQSYTPEWTFREGLPQGAELPAIIVGGPAWRDRQNLQNARSKVKVLGYMPSGPTQSRANAGRRDGSAPWASPDADEADLVDVIQSDCLETDADCAAVALDRMLLRNRPEELITIRTPGGQDFCPMHTFRVIEAASVGLGDNPFTIIRIHESISTTWTVELTGLLAVLGGGGGPFSLLPIPAFTTSSVLRANALTGLNDTLYTCDGTMASDSEGQGPAQLSYAWSTNAVPAKRNGNGATSQADGQTGAVFAFAADPATVFLGNVLITQKVRGPDGLEAWLTKNAGAG